MKGINRRNQKLITVVIALMVADTHRYALLSCQAVAEGTACRTLSCGDITNDQFGISEETVFCSRNLPIY